MEAPPQDTGLSGSFERGKVEDIEEGREADKPEEGTVGDKVEEGSKEVEGKAWGMADKAVEDTGDKAEGTS